MTETRKGPPPPPSLPGRLYESSVSDHEVQEFMWRHNPVLKLRCQTSGLVWAWQMMSRSEPTPGEGRVPAGQPRRSP